MGGASLARISLFDTPPSAATQGEAERRAAQDEEGDCAVSSFFNKPCTDTQVCVTAPKRGCHYKKRGAQTKKAASVRKRLGDFIVDPGLVAFHLT